jgi:hypothetical protein
MNTIQTIEAVKMATCELCDVSHDYLVGQIKKRPIVRSRHAAMSAANAMGKTLSEIGRAFSNRDHTSVLWAIRAVERDEDQRILRDRIVAKAREIRMASDTARLVTDLPFRSSRAPKKQVEVIEAPATTCGDRRKVKITLPMAPWEGARA